MSSPSDVPLSDQEEAGEITAPKMATSSFDSPGGGAPPNTVADLGPSAPRLAQSPPAVPQASRATNASHAAPVIASNSDSAEETDEAAWYVRVPSGEQYGPAEESLFRDWIQQGRVGASCLVWREGWPDWQNAAVVLREFQSPPKTTPPPPSESQPPIPVSNNDSAFAQPIAPRINAEQAPRDVGNGIRIETDRPIKQVRSKSMWPVVLLFLACLLMLIPLVYVFVSS